MKKFIIIVLVIIITFLLGLNIYVISSNTSISNDIDKFQSSRDELTSLEDFSENIVNLAHMQKSFLLTGNTKFKTQYSESLNKAYTTIDELLNEETISNADKVELLGYLNDYEDLNTPLLSSPPSLPLSNEDEAIVIKSDNLQNNILRKTSNLIAEKIDSSGDDSSTISDSISNQNNIIQLISSFFTIGISGPIYYFVKKYKSGEISFNNIIDSISKEKKTVDEYACVLAYINLTNSLNSQLEKEWQDVSNLVNTLQNSIRDIDEAVSSISLSDKINFENKLKNIEFQLLEIKLLVQQLPNYHKLIIQLSETLTEYKKN